jgi:putative FmdB family regulatory protein
MPIYEYECTDCNKKVSIFFLSYSEANSTKPSCPECGNQNLNRIFSQISVSQQNNEQSTTKSKAANSDLEDPKTLAREMERGTSNPKADYGEDFKEVKGRLDKGESPVSIETKMRKRVGEKMTAH